MGSNRGTNAREREKLPRWICEILLSATGDVGCPSEASETKGAPQMGSQDLGLCVTLKTCREAAICWWEDALEGGCNLFPKPRWSPALPYGTALVVRHRSV